MEQHSDDSIIFEDVVIKEEIDIMEEEDNYFKEEDNYYQEEEEESPSDIPLEVKLEAPSPVPPDPHPLDRRHKVHNLLQALEENMRDAHCVACYNRMLDLCKFMEVHQFDAQLCCNLCHSTFSSEDLLQLHKQFYHPLAPIPPTDRKWKISEPPMQLPRKRAKKSKILLDCPYCPRRCISNSQLRNHLASHSNDRPFSCSFCPKKFKLKDSLSVHEQIHNKNRPQYQCTQCSGLFRCIYYFRKHLKKKHKISNTAPHEREACRYPEHPRLAES